RVLRESHERPRAVAFGATLPDIMKGKVGVVPVKPPKRAATGAIPPAAEDAEQRAADADASPPDAFPSDAQRLAKTMAHGRKLELGFLAVGGWDTHARQGGANGLLADRLARLAEGLLALANGLGPRWGDTMVVVVSEFGRSVAENAEGGTDHGYGN